VFAYQEINMRYTTPDIKIEFEHQIRRAHLWVEACAWADDEGIYKTQLNDAMLDGVSVLELLTDDDLTDITDAIEDAIHAEASDRKATEFIPSRDAHKLGD
jgi:hypothetical protein